MYGIPDWARHIAFRDFRRAHEAVRKAYEQPKQDLSRQKWEHGMAYNAGKDVFVKRVEGEVVKWWER